MMLSCSELAVRDSRARELREERDAVMASVRQRDSALQASFKSKTPHTCSSEVKASVTIHHRAPEFHMPI